MFSFAGSVFISGVVVGCRLIGDLDSDGFVPSVFDVLVSILDMVFLARSEVHTRLHNPVSFGIAEVSIYSAVPDVGFGSIESDGVRANSLGLTLFPSDHGFSVGVWH